MDVFLGSWARQLAFLILFVSIIEMILPHGELRRYVKMILGLVVLVAMMEPLFHMVQGDEWINALLAPATMVSSELGSPVAVGTAMAKTAINDAATLAQLDLEDTIAALLLTMEGVEDAQVRFLGTRSEVKLVIRSGASADIQSRTARMVAGIAKLNPADVDVKIVLGVVG